MEKYEDIAQELFILNQKTVDALFSLGGEAFVLYSFYYKTSKWQKTNSVWATNEYVMKKLGWGRDRVVKAKKVLLDNGFIKQERILDETKKVKSWNIKICYLTQETTPLKSSEEATPLKTPPVANQDTYIYNNNKISKDNYNNNNIYIKNNIYPDLDDNEILGGWNTIATKYQLPQIKLLDQRKEKLIKILQKHNLTLQEFFNILDDRINKSLFLQGVVQRSDGSGGYMFEHTGKWHCDFDFFLQPTRFVKVMENSYTDGVFLK